MDDQKGLFSLFQIVDSFFPSGSFAYSWGLETYVNDGIVKDRKGLEEFLKAYLTGSIVSSDALIMKLSFEAAEREDIDTILYFDRLIHSMKLARETREGSIQIGKQLLRVMAELHRSTLFESLHYGIETKKAYGHHPVVFAVVGKALGIYIEQTILAYMYQVVSGVVSAGVRLIPLGHMDGQRVIEEIKPLVLNLVGTVMLRSKDDISSFAPGLEIRAMRHHEDLYTRLFKS